jgi:predicted Zn-dependent peptidase
MKFYSSAILDSKSKSNKKEPESGNPTEPVFMMAMGFPFGSMHEPKHFQGLSHLVEHILFHSKSSKKTSESRRKISEVGGVWNAFTMVDCTVYYIIVPMEHAAMAIEIMRTHILGPIVISKQAFELEKKIVLEEKSYRESNPGMIEKVTKMMTENTPYAETDVVGNEKTIHAITLKDVHDFKKKLMSDLKSFSTVIIAPQSKHAFIKSLLNGKGEEKEKEKGLFGYSSSSSSPPLVANAVNDLNRRVLKAPMDNHKYDEHEHGKKGKGTKEKMVNKKKKKTGEKEKEKENVVVFKADKDEADEFVIAFRGFAKTDHRAHVANLVAFILKRDLFEEVREKLGGIYRSNVYHESMFGMGIFYVILHSKYMKALTLWNILEGCIRRLITLTENPNPKNKEKLQTLIRAFLRSEAMSNAMDQSNMLLKATLNVMAGQTLTSEVGADALESELGNVVRSFVEGHRCAICKTKDTKDNQDRLKKSILDFYL